MPKKLIKAQGSCQQVFTNDIFALRFNQPIKNDNSLIQALKYSVLNIIIDIALMEKKLESKHFDWL